MGERRVVGSVGDDGNRPVDTVDTGRVAGRGRIAIRPYGNTYVYRRGRRARRPTKPRPPAPINAIKDVPI